MKKTSAIFGMLSAFTVTLSAQVVSSGTDLSTAALWRTGATLEADNQYGTLGYVIFGLNLANNVFVGPANLSNPGSGNVYALPSGISISTASTSPGIWSGSPTGNFGFIQDPGNGNALTPAPVVANASGTNRWIISRSVAAAYRITLMTASGDGENKAFTLTMNDGAGSAVSTYQHTVNGLVYSVFDVPSGASNIVIDVGVAPATSRSLMGIAFDSYVSPVVIPGVKTWQTNGSGNWSAPANWNPSVPNAILDRARFNGASPITATLDVPVTLGELTFESAQPVTIAGPSALAFNNLGIGSMLSASAGDHLISADVSVTGSIAIALDPSSSLEISGSLTSSGAFDFSGGGDLTLTGDLSGLTGGGSIAGGSLILDQDVNLGLAFGIGGSGALVKQGSGTLTFSGGGKTYTGGTVVSAGALDLAVNDVFGTFGGSQANMTIGAGALVTNSTGAVNGFNTFNTLTLNGGELRTTNARTGAYGSYGIKTAVTVGGTVPSLISGNPASPATRISWAAAFPPRSCSPSRISL